jgi:hypothetical protein
MLNIFNATTSSTWYLLYSGGALEDSFERETDESVDAGSQSNKAISTSDKDASSTGLKGKLNM